MRKWTQATMRWNTIRTCPKHDVYLFPHIVNRAGFSLHDQAWVKGDTGEMTMVRTALAWHIHKHASSSVSAVHSHVLMDNKYDITNHRAPWCSNRRISCVKM